MLRQEARMSDNLRIYLPMIWETPFAFKKNPCCFQERVLFSSDSWTCYLVEYWSWISNPPAPTSWFWDYSHHPQFDVELWIKPRALDTVDKQTTNSAASSDHCWVCWSIWDSSPTKVRRHKKRQICGSIKTMHYKKSYTNLGGHDVASLNLRFYFGLPSY